MFIHTQIKREGFTKAYLLCFYLKSFSTCTNPIIPLFYPPKICTGIVLDYSWEITNNEYANFGGVKEVHYGIVQVVNWDGLGVDTANALWQ